MDTSPTRETVVTALQRVIDPELGIDIVALGLIYGIEFPDAETVRLHMTMTTPACPLKRYIAHRIVQELGHQGCGLKRVHIEWVWDPPWSPAYMQPEARRQLGFRFQS